MADGGSGAAAVVTKTAWGRPGGLVVTAARPAFRTQLVPDDPDRNWAYAWDRNGKMPPGPWAVGGRPATSFYLGATNADLWWHRAYHGGFRLPPGLGAGSYPTPLGFPVTVKAAPPRRATVVPAGNSAAAVRAAFATGYLQVTLAPGEHVWDSPVATPPWAVIRGYGAVVRVLLSGASYNPALCPGDHLSVYGVTFVADTPAQVFLSQPVAGGVVADCTFKRIDLGWAFAGALVRDCEFVSCSVNSADPGLYLRCSFTGSPGQGFYCMYPRVANLAVIQCAFVRCNRGVVFNTANGEVADNLFLNLDYVGCTRPDAELFLVEGQGAGHAFDRNVIGGLHSTGCTGSLVQLDEVARNNLVAWPFQDAPGRGLVLGSPWTDGQVKWKDVSGNEFYGLDGWKPKVILGAAATNNTADGVPLAGERAAAQSRG
jgi:hypothetical protein